MYRKQFCERAGDREFMEIGFAHRFKPDGCLSCVEANEGECFAAIQLLEVFQLDSQWVDYRSHPILKIIEPAESAERCRIVSRHSIRIFQISGFENVVLLVLQQMRDCMVNREPVHPFW